MPVQKFRTLEEAERALWRQPGDQENLAIAASIRRTARKLYRGRFPSGIRRYRSIEDAARERDAWEAEALRRDR